MAVQFDPNAPDTIVDPYPGLAQLRHEEPMHWNPVSRAWYLTRYEDVRQGFRDKRLSADRIRPFVEAQKNGPDGEEIAFLGEHISHWAVFNDPPRHGHLRGLMNKAFTTRRVESLRGGVAEIVEGLIADWKDGEEIDFHQQFAYPLPATVIALLLGVPQEDVDNLKRWSDALAQFVLTSKTNPDKYRIASDALKEMNAYFADFLEQRRREPGELVTDGLISASDEGDRLTPEELTSSCILLLFAGHETTTQLMANGLLALIRHPDQMADFRANLDDPKYVANAVEELLRFDGPSLTSPRLVAEDFEMHGQTAKAGQRLWLWNCAANRDPDVFEDPERLNLRRENADRHVTFGFGIHFCIGAPLARLEAQVAFPILLKRFSDFELLRETQVWSDSYVSRGMTTLPLRVHR
ncbi:MAG: cytochrome P450 [Minwuia sp.]|uniref:cytochrome P450 n=1 Tax=Minwuia sp. TaxID=2493630 RepID=UPI003A867FA1